MDAEVYQGIKNTVKSLLDIDLTGYKDAQMRRRLDSWLARRGESSWSDYFKRVRADADEQSRLRDFLTINVSAFFRDPERWQELRDKVLPDLLKRTPHGLRVWSAGCSIGPEPYSLAMLFNELTPRRHTLAATDIDRGALARAKARGPYKADDIRHAAAVVKGGYFESDGPSFYVSRRIADGVQFGEHNLLADEFDSDFDLIVCRNVMIYFTDEAKTTLLRKFQAALRSDGILFLGSTEIVPRPRELGLRACGLSLYCKA